MQERRDGYFLFGGGSGYRDVVRSVDGGLAGEARWTEDGCLLGSESDHAVDPPVKEEHEEARNVEWRHGGIDEEVGVVKGADGRGFRPLLGVVHAEDDGQGDGDGDEPGQPHHDVDSPWGLVLGVLDRSGHGSESKKILKKLN